MPRMFDILRNNTADSDTPGAKDKKTQEAGGLEINLSTTAPDVDFIETREPEDHFLVSRKLISEVKKHGIDNQAKANEIYNDAIQAIKILLEKANSEEDLRPFRDAIDAILEDIFNQLVLGESILDNIYKKNEGEYYLPYHILNVLILSYAIGLSVGFNKSRLNHLGWAVMFYDFGMDAFQKVTGLSRELTSGERYLLKSHFYKSLKIAERAGSFDKVVFDTIRMHHEREGGEGYPNRIKSGEINLYAKIIGLVDTYESLTNHRPYRKEMSAHQAIKFLLGSLKNSFDPEIMKVFINKMSVYPIGSIVRLNTYELARVTSVKSGSPLLPVVMLIQDVSGEPFRERTIIDLTTQDSFFILESI